MSQEKSLKTGTDFSRSPCQCRAKALKHKNFCPSFFLFCPKLSYFIVRSSKKCLSKDAILKPRGISLSKALNTFFLCQYVELQLCVSSLSLLFVSLPLSIYLSLSLSLSLFLSFSPVFESVLEMKQKNFNQIRQVCQNCLPRIQRNLSGNFFQKTVGF